MKAITVISKETGAIHTAIYAPNRLGNMRYAVAGRFYSDKEFDKRYEIVVESEVDDDPEMDEDFPCPPEYQWMAEAAKKYPNINATREQMAEWQKLK